MPHPDIIIVGAGSAGCILASRLAGQFADRADHRIVVIEPASTPAPSVNRDRPSHWLYLIGSSEDWDHTTDSMDSLAGRPLRWPRGRGPGGSSRINAMIWFPPTQSDLETIAAAAQTEITTVQAAYKAVKSTVQPESAKWQSVAAKQFVLAAEDHGNPTRYQRVNRGGRRWTPGELLNHDNIEVFRETVDRVFFDGDQAAGVRLANGEEIHAADRVYLCAGAIATPMILMRSGIGPTEMLSACGIDVRIDEPSVGANLQDHLIMPVVFGMQPEYFFDPRASEEDVLLWEENGDGPVASNIAEAGGLFDDAQIQIHVTPTHYLLYPNPKTPPALTIGVNVTQPKSRGRLSITSADPNAPPCIQPNYLASQYDLEKTIEGVRLARQIAAHRCFDGIITSELLPGIKRESDESIIKSIQRFSQTLYHPVGTAADIKTGVDNLHVVDASALKNITVGNPNAAVMTLADSFARQG